MSYFSRSVGPHHLVPPAKGKTRVFGDLEITPATPSSEKYHAALWEPLSPKSNAIEDEVGV